MPVPEALPSGQAPIQKVGPAVREAGATNLQWLAGSSSHAFSDPARTQVLVPSNPKAVKDAARTHEKRFFISGTCHWRVRLWPFRSILNFVFEIELAEFTVQTQSARSNVDVLTALFNYFTNSRRLALRLGSQGKMKVHQSKKAQGSQWTRIPNPVYNQPKGDIQGRPHASFPL